MVTEKAESMKRQPHVQPERDGLSSGSARGRSIGGSPTHHTPLSSLMTVNTMESMITCGETPTEQQAQEHSRWNAFLSFGSTIWSGDRSASHSLPSRASKYRLTITVSTFQCFGYK